jgi:His-Xaa-Ser system radical SAM maturase HxsB
MNLETARSLVDLIFQGQNKEITIEFQGGEPLLNWPIIRFIIDYAKLRNRAGQKILHFGLISNFSLLDDQKLDWLIERGVSFCTSLDGPPDLHDTNRVFLGGNGHEKTISGIKAIQSRRAAGIKVDIPNVISTVTKGSLNRANEIVDQVVSLGLERVQVGPLDPIGFARRSWARIGYEPKEFVDFYGQVLDAIIERNQQGIKLYEKMAMILLVRILRNEHWRFPFGDVIARIAYDWNGSVFSSEDGRLLAADNDAFFKLGHVQSTSLIDLLDQPLAQIGLLSSQAWSQPMCMQCVYSPYCSVQPVHNHATQGSVWGQMPTNRWCATIMGVFDAIFTRLNDPVKRKVLESWLDYADR